MVLGIVNRPGCQSPDRSVRFAVATPESTRAIGSSIACDLDLDEIFFQRVGRGPTEAFKHASLHGRNCQVAKLPH